MKKYKLTTQNMTTRCGFQWELNIPKEADGDSTVLCNDQWLHYYHHPLLAILLNPVHGDIINPKLFECKAEGKHLDDRGLKGGCTKMTLIKELELPKITLEQKVAFGILCALEVYKKKSFVKWANNWLEGVDRTNDTDAAYATTDAAYAVYATTYATAYATNAATAAIRATDAAAIRADYGAYTGIRAAYAATDAAYAAAYAAYAAACATKLDLIKLAKKCLKY
jgi:hypothetical protein